jgi:Protein of unknown function (DUF2846)
MRRRAGLVAQATFPTLPRMTKFACRVLLGKRHLAGWTVAKNLSMCVSLCSAGGWMITKIGHDVRSWQRLRLSPYGLAAFLMGIPLLFGCGATGAQFKPEPDKPSVNGALLYVYRPHTVIGIANADVPIMHLDGQRLTRIRIGGYLNIPISASKHTLTTTESLLGSDTGRVRGETTFSVRAGSTLYLRYTESFKTFVPVALPAGVAVVSSGNYRFEYVPEAEARAELANTTALEMDQKNP